MTRFRKSSSFVTDIALFAVLAQLWLALSCCVSQPAGEHAVFGADTWCSIDNLSTSQPGEHAAHECDCVMMGTPVIAEPVTANLLLPRTPEPTSTVVAEHPPLKGLLHHGTIGSRAPPASLQTA
ncbi:hypothetical protein [Kordiimonas sp.]|uniref:hypothetical protein n=1 Tax=Kordiimonas sp. TaxID=1970157 RepID=UPI003A92CA3E